MDAFGFFYGDVKNRIADCDDARFFIAISLTDEKVVECNVVH
jgi:hypothetical protein